MISSPGTTGTTVDAIPTGPAPGLAAPALSRRMACFVYEGMLLFGVVFVAAYLFGTLSQTRNAMNNRHALQLFLFVVFGIYFTWFWARGQTLAMKTWGIHLVDSQGRPATQQRAFVRYLASRLWFLPPLAATAPFTLSGSVSFMVIATWVILWALLSRLHPRRQFWHDAWAGTQLVSTAKPAA